MIMLYIKTINGQQKISRCTTLHLEDGTWVANPTEEQIIADGWEPYTPPEIVPEPQNEPDMMQTLQAIKTMFSSETEALSDVDALAVAALYPTWSGKIGETVEIGERYWYNGKLYKVVQQHTVQSDWTPDVAMSLFSEVTVEEYPEWKQSLGSTDAYMNGDKVSYNGKHYECISDYNVYAPDVYGWRELS